MKATAVFYWREKVCKVLSALKRLAHTRARVVRALFLIKNQNSDITAVGISIADEKDSAHRQDW